MIKTADTNDGIYWNKHYMYMYLNDLYLQHKMSSILFWSSSVHFSYANDAKIV